MASDENLDNISNYSEEDFMACYGNVSGNSEDTWRSGLKLHDDEHTVPSSGSSRYDSNRHQLCIIINDTSKEFNAENNSIMNPQNLERGAKHRAEGETESAVATRDKVHLSAAEWQIINAAVNHGAVIPANSTREVLMGYQYALYQQKKRLLQEKSEIRRRQVGQRSKQDTTRGAQQRVIHEWRTTPRARTQQGKYRARKQRKPRAELTHHFCQSMKEGTLCQRHQR
jgi:hypothetical protein